MKTSKDFKTQKQKNVKNKDIVDYYDNAGLDYKYWSKSFNMHFGYCNKSPFNREKMLEEMNKKVFECLKINDKSNGTVLDLGCGLGATSISGALKFPNINFKGINITQWQINKGNKNIKLKNLKNVQLFNDDFHQLNTVIDESIDMVFALESICHSNRKNLVITQINRVLKKGGKLVIIDGFVKKEESEFSFLFKKMYKALCDGWSLPNMDNIYAFKNKVENQNFEITNSKDISWKIAPSVIHAPFVCLWFLMDNILKRKKLHRQSIKNLKASFISLFLGMHRNAFGYYLISATKK